MRAYYYNDTRLMMLRARRRVFLRRMVGVGIGFLALAAASAFVVGLHGGGV